MTTLALMVGWVLASPASIASAQSPVWSRPFKLSNDGTSWFPAITADVYGRVHVIWSSETLNYRMFDGNSWTPTRDIAVALDASGNAVFDNPFRATISASTNGYLHLFYYHLIEALGYYMRAPVDLAGQPSAWTNHQVIGARDNGYYTAMAIDSQNHIHVVYVDRPSNTLLSDVFYRRSEDNGLTWTPPVNLSNTPQTGSSRLQIMIDRTDTIHVSWDEGWDRRTGEGTTQTSMYVSSSNGGKTWAAPVTFGTTKLPSMQLVVAPAAAPNSRVAVWRSPADDNVYYQTSMDGGVTWSAITPISGLIARPANSPPFDQYALARDDQGIVHFVLVARRSAAPDSLLNVSHLEWDGQTWSKPEVIFERTGLYPEYPNVAIALGNQVHVVWFTRTDLWQTSNLDVWHTYRAMPPLYTPAASLATPIPSTPTPKSTATVTPTILLARPLPSTAVEAPLPSLATISMFPLAAGILAPVLVVIVALVLRRR